MKPIDFWVNKILCGDCLEVMREFPDECIDLAVTSPPYFNLKEYAFWESYTSYLVFVKLCFSQLSRVLKSGGHICWVVQDNIPEPTKQGRHYYPLMPDTVKIAIKSDLEWEMNVIWSKGTTKLYFGSYPFPPTPIFNCSTESILIFKKRGKLSSSFKEKSKLSKSEWFKYTSRNVWKIPNVKRNNEHLAPFPEEIPLRCVKLMSFVNSIVLDPFVGSGTTCVVAHKLGRKWIGIDVNSNYVEVAKRRLERECSQHLAKWQG